MDGMEQLPDQYSRERKHTFKRLFLKKKRPMRNGWI
jgi:hypothetical protein